MNDYEITGTFLNYHPNIAATGEIAYFTNDREYKKGKQYYLRQLPRARWRDCWHARYI